MHISESGIYPYIRNHLDSCEVVHVAKDVNFCPSFDESNLVWYLLSGTVEDLLFDQAGNKFVVDTNVPDEFTGHLSNYWGQNFYCDSVAKTDCELIRIPNELFDHLMENPEFRSFFYFKIGIRLYDMHKRYLATRLYNDTQIFASYIITNMRDGVCAIENATWASEQMHMSRRNFYNKLAQFERDGIIRRERGGIVHVLDEKRLREIALPVIRYLGNEL